MQTLLKRSPKIIPSTRGTSSILSTTASHIPPTSSIPYPITTTATAASRFHNKLSRPSFRHAFHTNLISAKDNSTPTIDKGEKLFDKILIANRGEITCRVIATCKKLGIKTVAVYSEVDANAKHVKMADEAYFLGPAPVNQSYLVVEKIIEACKATGAQAVHPGYGFLSENTHFAGRCEEEGIAFIGPPASAIQAMGDKIESKKIAIAAGVNTIPGYDGEVESTEHAVKLAKEIGYPVMIKASAGGGGKGMRVAHNDEELVEGFNLSRAEATNFFGDNRMLIEKFIENPRHVEIQIICDTHGNRFYLPERECSIQRRNQKVIEEAPCVALDEATRVAMGKQAIALAAKVDYVSAGTVECMLDPNNNFYFLEMNTRLQVEHPITEFITGIDLVEQMIRAAAGLPLSIKSQEDIKINGWATECRVYAEDPSKNFAPSIGTLEMYKEPSTEGGNVRIDSGILEGSEISMYYDPMISKLISYGKDRPESIKRMLEALDTYLIRGVKHNIPLLRSVLTKKRYLEGTISTDFIKEEYGPEGFTGVTLSEKQHNHLIASAALVRFLYRRREMTITNQLRSSKPHNSESFFVGLDGKKYPVNIEIENGLYIVELQDSKQSIVVKTGYHVGEFIFRSTMNDKYNVIMQILEKNGTNLLMRFLGTEFALDVKTPRESELQQYMPEKTAADFSKFLMAPMPGSVVRVDVKPGDKVAVNQAVLVLEAMKMQNTLRSSGELVVKEVLVKAGDIVSNNQKLIVFE